TQRATNRRPLSAGGVRHCAGDDAAGRRLPMTQPDTDRLAEIFGDWTPFDEADPQPAPEVVDQPTTATYDAWDEAQRSMAALAYTLLALVVGFMLGGAFVLHWLVRVLVR